MKITELFAEYFNLKDYPGFFEYFIDTIGAFLIAISVWRILRWTIKKFVKGFVQKTKTKWDDIMLEKRVFSRMSQVFPALILQDSIPKIYVDFPEFANFFHNLMEAWIIFVFAQVMIATVNVFEHVVKQYNQLKGKPVGSYFQLVRIVIYFFAIIWMVSVVIQKDPMSIIATFGALTAVILLIFKDTILGFVASVQIASNDIVRIDDWISVPKYGADGTVLDISLNTVKVRNFDKTITTIPTYALVSDSFKNYRFMSESKTRRIKRSIIVASSSIKYCDDALLSRLKKIDILQDFLEERIKEILAHNKSHETNTELLINGRHLTNIGLFRFYIESFMANNPNIDNNSTRMVLQLAQNEKGVPLQLYCFTNTPEWEAFEGIQADIFDHIFAAASLFELEIFQEPSSYDLKQIKLG
ncbi:MAG: mechanosensitive ion channel family protein [Flavobacteriales bacterium]|jgi:miniconductance mechanosensitive channel|nr:mechanosensitive ion channel family protein [Flavobacteriales bacterium]